MEHRLMTRPSRPSARAPRFSVRAPVRRRTLAARRTKQAGQCPQQRALPGPVWSDQRQACARRRPVGDVPRSTGCSPSSDVEPAELRRAAPERLAMCWRRRRGSFAARPDGRKCEQLRLPASRAEPGTRPRSRRRRRSARQARPAAAAADLGRSSVDRPGAVDSQIDLRWRPSGGRRRRRWRQEPPGKQHGRRRRATAIPRSRGRRTAAPAGWSGESGPRCQARRSGRRTAETAGRRSLPCPWDASPGPIRLDATSGRRS